ncbi:Transcription factor IIIC, subunit 5 [Drechmeria coniospora]|uniref:Transcription factor IIIC, subunit 5 n=1 Tax=Drechmeria coniospora TaxID=98403 RepID=A0A151GJT3_DRECN|nr:Transcription factor IIIC, subunit 5 [Drechmeria coniospora]KYK57272.1 Transcription factor IIIC, subunit 5 [Drechmeria coniospora]
MASSSEADDDMLVEDDVLADDDDVPADDDDVLADSPTLQDEGAPRYAVPSRYLAAVEIPAVVENIERAVNAFGRVPSLAHVLDPSRPSLPLYLNPESPFCPPVMSHNASSHNVVLKVVVPKRTGRRRKRGSHGPWQGDVDVADASAAPQQVCSVGRLDQPKVLRRKLADNVDEYRVEAVGVIKHTHRFRGLADFYWDMSRSPFAQKYANQVLPGDVQQIKNFKFEPGMDLRRNVDIIPPPIFTHMSLPFNYYYSQNPYVRNTADGGTINTTAVKQVGYFISAEDPAPTRPQHPPDVTDARTMEVIAQLEEAFQHRPVWTRRSLLNHLGGKLHNWNELKKYLNYTAYQFKGGPWRDGVVPYGIDPRTDPKYRVYQTLMFKLSRKTLGVKDQTWAALRRSQLSLQKNYAEDECHSHVFDGESFHTDGKVWQVCDITDPLLQELLDNAEVRPTWDINSGWYHGGLWAKVKAIMKTKLVAIQFDRKLTRDDFAPTLECGDRTPVRAMSSTFHLPLPNLNLSKEELTALRGREPPKKKSSGYNVRIREFSKGASVGPDHRAGPGSVAQDSAAATEEDGMPYEDDEEDSGSEADNGDYEDEMVYPDPGAYADPGDGIYPTQQGPYGGHHRRRGGDYDTADGGVEYYSPVMSGAIYPELD